MYSAFSRVLQILFLVSLLGACAAPSARYTKLSTRGENFSGSSKFQFAHSVVSFTGIDDSKNRSYKATSVIVDDPKDDFYTIMGSSRSWGVKTNISAKHREGTNLIDSISVSIVDNRIKLIQGVGSALGAFAGLVTGGGVLAQNDPTAAFPTAPPSVAMDKYLELSDTDSSACPKNQIGNPVCTEKLKSSDAYGTWHWTLKMEVYPLEPGSQPIKTFEDNLGKNLSAVYFASCRQVNMILLLDSKDPPPTAPSMIRADPPFGEMVNTSLRIADPRAVEPVALPDKGKVVQRADCGGEATIEDSTIASGWEISAEMLKQAKTVHDAFKTSKSGSK